MKRNSIPDGIYSTSRYEQLEVECDEKVTKPSCTCTHMTVYWVDLDIGSCLEGRDSLVPLLWRSLHGRKETRSRQNRTMRTCPRNILERNDDPGPQQYSEISLRSWRQDSLLCSMPNPKFTIRHSCYHKAQLIGNFKKEARNVDKVL